MAAKKKSSTKRLKVEEVEETPTEDKKEEETPVKESTESSVSTKESGKEERPEEKKSQPDESSKDDKITTFQFADVKGDTKTPSKEKGAPKKEPEEKTEEKEEKKDKKMMSEEETKEWLKDIKSEGDEEPKGGRGKFFLIFFIVVILLGAIGGGIYYYQTNLKQTSEIEPQPSEDRVVVPTESMETEEEATESAEMESADYSVQVLNGSGVPGEAGNVAEILEETGFEGIDTGNADSYDYVETQVQMKEGVPDSVYETIKESLEDNYIIEQSDETLSEDSDFDIIVLVGSEKV
ncbi:MAG: LytR C-terminal domain-containing protein [Candidatus Woesebacteria bacterium]|jgi:hypothetical protein